MTHIIYNIYMRKYIILATAVATVVTLASCGGIGTMGGQTAQGAATAQQGKGGGLLGGIISAATSGQTIGNVLGNILGTDKPNEAALIGTWHYRQPGVAFESENLLAKAGGETMATQIKTKLQSTYDKLGYTGENTYFTFTDDHNFTGKLNGKTITGTWTYDEQECRIDMKTLLFSIHCYAKRTTVGMSYLFDAKKLLTLLQTAASFTGNSTLQGIGDLGKNYDGLKIGFDTAK